MCADTDLSSRSRNLTGADLLMTIDQGLENRLLEKILKGEEIPDELLEDAAAGAEARYPEEPEKIAGILECLIQRIKEQMQKKYPWLRHFTDRENKLCPESCRKILQPHWESFPPCPAVSNSPSRTTP